MSRQKKCGKFWEEKNPVKGSYGSEDFPEIDSSYSIFFFFFFGGGGLFTELLLSNALCPISVLAVPKKLDTIYELIKRKKKKAAIEFSYYWQ